MARKPGSSLAVAVRSVADEGLVVVEQTDEGETLQLLLRVEPDQEQRLRIVELTLAPGGPIAPETLRRIRLGAIEQMLNLPEQRAAIIEHSQRASSARGATRHGYQPRAWLTLGFVASPMSPPPAAEAARRPKEREPLRAPERGRYPASFYRQVAAAYRDALRHGLSPTRALTTEAHVKPATAARWIKEARRRGYLGAGHRGRAGEAGQLAVRYTGPEETIELPQPTGETRTLRRGESWRLVLDQALALLEDEKNWQPVAANETQAPRADRPPRRPRSNRQRNG